MASQQCLGVTAGQVRHNCSLHNIQYKILVFPDFGAHTLLKLYKIMVNNKIVTFCEMLFKIVHIVPKLQVCRWQAESSVHNRIGNFMDW